MASAEDIWRYNGNWSVGFRPYGWWEDEYVNLGPMREENCGTDGYSVWVESFGTNVSIDREWAGWQSLLPAGQNWARVQTWVFIPCAGTARTARYNLMTNGGTWGHNYSLDQYIYFMDWVAFQESDGSYQSYYMACQTGSDHLKLCRVEYSGGGEYELAYDDADFAIVG